MKSVFVLLGLFLMSAVTPLRAQIPLEHFKCYVIRGIDPIGTFVIPRLELKDQFETPDVVDFMRPRRFCNPAGKFHRNQFFPVEDIRQHLTFYATFPQEGPYRTVTLSNQFDRPGAPPPTWLLREPVALAVPAQKQPHEPPFPRGLDHYRCYGAYGGLVGEGIGLLDQFSTAFTGHIVLNPVLFCNPVQKTRGDTGEVTPILNPDQHLACYAMTRLPFQGTVDVRDQFGPYAFRLGPADTVCVPTRKIAWTEIPDGPIGGPALDALDALSP